MLKIWMSASTIIPTPSNLSPLNNSNESGETDTQQNESTIVFLCPIPYTEAPGMPSNLIHLIRFNCVLVAGQGFLQVAPTL